MGIFLSLLAGLLPMLFFAWIVYWFDRYEKEPKILLGVVFFWGAVIAAGSAFVINSILGMEIYLFTGSKAATDLTTGALIAPFVEETLKGLAVLLVFLLFRSEFDSILDGIVYAGIVALGFAATENAFYIYRFGYVENGIIGLWQMVFVRVLMVGWQHPFYTAFIGIGLAVARLNQSKVIKFGAPFIGWTTAVFAHSLHNTLASAISGTGGLVLGTALDWIGWSFMLLFIFWVISREHNWISDQLKEEVLLGSITPAQYRTACSTWFQNSARLEALLKGRYHKTARFYQICAELAYKKKQLALMGEEQGNSHIIQQLRAELLNLSPHI